MCNNDDVWDVYNYWVLLVQMQSVGCYVRNEGSTECYTTNQRSLIKKKINDKGIKKILPVQMNKVRMYKRYDVQAWNYIRRLGRRSSLSGIQLLKKRERTLPLAIGIHPLISIVQGRLTEVLKREIVVKEERRVGVQVHNDEGTVLWLSRWGEAVR